MTAKGQSLRPQNQTEASLKIKFLPLLFFLISDMAWTQDDMDIIEEITVYASLDNSPSEDLISTTVLLSDQYEAFSVFSIQDISKFIPNLNWSGEGSRTRYFQIRGIGEREQYQGAPNASVGFIIDDIDLTGIAMASNLYGISQVEVLRGPQGTINGSNALAGLVYLKSKDPEDELSIDTNFQFGSDDLKAYGFNFSLPLSNTVSARYMVQKMGQNGFMENEFYKVDDTNHRNELIHRLNTRINLTSRSDLNLNLLVADFNNGYDAWTNDNSRKTYSDYLGKDKQNLNAFSLNYHHQFDELSSRLVMSQSNSNMFIAYDGDWGNDDYWGVLYDFTSETQRVRKQRTFDWSISTNSPEDNYNLIGGLYLKTVDEENMIDEIYNGFVYRDSDSVFNGSYLALYGDFKYFLSDQLTFNIGLRTEEHLFDYLDGDLDYSSPDYINQAFTLGSVYQLSDLTQIIFTASQGYKFGGINIGTFVPNEFRFYDSENLMSYELGVNSELLDGAVRLKSQIFYSSRNNQQISTSIQLDPQDPLSFIYLTKNFDAGENKGIEAEAEIFFSQRLHARLSAGFLDAVFADTPEIPLNLRGREQAYAPSFQWSALLNYQLNDNLQIQGSFFKQDGYFFDESHDQQATGYSLVDIAVVYSLERTQITFWTKNILNQDYPIRGFYFSNDPNDPLYLPNLFIRSGDPVQAGITLDYLFH